MSENGSDTAQTVVITGASTGIGRATAERFAREGWKVAATMRQPEEHAELGRVDGVTLYRLDVTDHDEVTAAAITLSLASSEIDEAAYAAWLDQNTSV